MAQHTIISPVDGKAFATVSISNEPQANSLLHAAKKAQSSWVKTPLNERLNYIRAFLSAFVLDKERIAEELTWQMGRPIAYAPKEVERLVERAQAMIDVAERGLSPLTLHDAGSTFREVRRVPHGVCLVVAPWNYPYLTAVNTIVPALIAGNAVILKPAAQTALTGDRFAAAFATAGLPAGVFSSALLSHETVAGWVASRSVDFVSFTGSVRGGTEIERSAAGSFLPISLELGGKDPAYVREDADLEFAVNELVDGSFFNSGQSCCGVERIYVDRKIYSAFADRFVEVTRASQLLGNPTEPATTLGPLVSTKAARSVRDQIEKAIADGAELALGEDNPNANSAYLPATVLLNVNHSMDVMTEESFGPVVGIMPVDSDHQAAKLMNDSKYGLSASVWTQDVAVGLAFGEVVETGTFFVNRCDYLDPSLAWTGIKDTGRGCSLSEWAYHHLTRPKSFYARR